MAGRIRIPQAVRVLAALGSGGILAASLDLVGPGARGWLLGASALALLIACLWGLIARRF